MAQRAHRAQIVLCVAVGECELGKKVDSLIDFLWLLWTSNLIMNVKRTTKEPQTRKLPVFWTVGPKHKNKSIFCQCLRSLSV